AISAVGVPSRPTTASLSATPELPPDFPGGLAQAAVPRASAASTAAAPIRRLDLICSPQSWFLQIVADEGSVLTTVAQPGSAANNRSMNERVTPAIGSAVVAMVGLAAVIGSGALVDRERGSSASYAGASTLFAVLELGVGGAVLAAAGLLLAERSTTRVGALSVAAAVAWLAPVW